MEEELTHKNMDSFFKQLQLLLAEPPLTFLGAQGFLHKIHKVKSLKMNKLPDGLWEIVVDLDGLQQRYTSFYHKPGVMPIVNHPQLARTWFTFAPTELSTRTTLLHSAVNKQITTKFVRSL